MRKPRYEQMFSALRPTTDIPKQKSSGNFHYKSHIAKRSAFRLSRIKERELILGRRGDAAPACWREAEL